MSGESASSSHSITIPARDGFPLAATIYGSDAGSDAWVILNSAMGVRQGFYGSYARFLAAAGLRVVSYDYRGMGASRPADIRGFAARMRDWGQLDFSGVLDWVAAQGASGIGAVGHSAGAQILGLADLSKMDVIVAATPQNGYWKLWPLPHRWFLASLWFFWMPVLSRLLGRFPSRWFLLGQELPKGVALEWSRWCRRPDYLRSFPDEFTTDGFERFRGPLYGVSVQDDPFAPPKAVQAYLDWYAKAAAIERTHLPRRRGESARAAHFSIFRQQGLDLFWKPSLNWLRGALVDAGAAKDPSRPSPGTHPPPEAR